MLHRSVLKPDKSCCNKAGGICQQILEPGLETSRPWKHSIAEGACVYVHVCARAHVCDDGCSSVWVTSRMQTFPHAGPWA